MKKIILLFTVVTGFLFTSIVFTACSKNDTKGPGNDNVSIIGTWKKDEFGYEKMQLGKDGSYLRTGYSAYTDGKPDFSCSDYRKGTYTYNPQQGLLVVSVVAVPNHNGAYSNALIVQTLTATTLVLLYSDGDVEGVYTRMN